MTQVAQVKRIIPGNKAEIAVVRQGACAHNCSECGGCMTAQQPAVYWNGMPADSITKGV